MVERGGVAGNVVAKSGVILSVRTGKHLHAAERAERISRCNLSAHLQAVDHRIHVARVGKVIGVNGGSVQRIVGAQLYPAPAEWTYRRWPQRVRVAFDLLESV